MASQAETWPSHLRDNTLRMYYGLDESMAKAHKNEDWKRAESTARTLLEHADLPLLIRARALMVLGCSSEPDCLEMAAEAVRIVEVGIESIESQGRTPGWVETQLLKDCKQVCQEALAEFEKQDGDSAAEESNQLKVSSEQGFGNTSAQQDDQHESHGKTENAI